MIRRREFIAGLGGAAAWPLAAGAQQAVHMRHIGVLLGVSDPLSKSNVAMFTQALANLGWPDGRDLRMDLRWYGDDAIRVRALAQELVGLQPDIIQTRTIPIVFAGVSDPVAQRIVHGGRHRS